MIAQTNESTSNECINCSTPIDESAILDIRSTNKGILISRMSLQQRNSIVNPAKGLLVFVLDEVEPFFPIFLEK